MKLNEKTLRQLAEQSNLTQPLEDVEFALTLMYLSQRLILALQVEQNCKDVDISGGIKLLYNDIVEQIKTIV